jgi:hypothetical protein
VVEAAAAVFGQMHTVAGAGVAGSVAGAQIP